MMRASFTAPRDARVAAALLALVGAVCAFIPLFNLVGYESAATAGVALGLASLVLTWRRIGARSPRDPRWRDAPAWFVSQAWRLMLLGLVPLAVLCLNALRVRHCDWSTGLTFWLLIVPMASLLGQSASWAAAALLGPGKRRLALALGFVALDALSMGLHLALQPPITGHQWWIGYMSGSLYDEALGVPVSLVWYRLINLAGVLTLVVCVELWRRHRARAPRAPWAALAIACGVMWGVTHLERQRFGVAIDREHIAQTLGGRVETEHFIIYYPLHDGMRRQLDLLIEDHEYRYDELRAYLGTDPVKETGEKLRSYVYLSRDQKGALMGARNTLIAKIWLGEIHILWRGVGDHLLAHELAHLFTAPFASGPLKLSMQGGVGVNMGLVEGIATAADWPVSELTPHEASATMRHLAIAPDIRGLVGASGFWTQASGKAYTLMGSFVRYLIETHGIATFKKAYAQGDFEGAYGQPVDTLVSAWEAYLDTITVRPEWVALARYRYTRPSIFGKVCARAIAELRRRASDASLGGDAVTALALYDEIVGFLPEDTSARIDQIRALERAGRLDDALTRLDAMLAEPPGEHELVTRAVLQSLRGDMLWLQSREQEAATAYDTCLASDALDADARRLTRARREALTRPAPARALARAYLLESPPESVALFFPMRWLEAMPDDALASYLVGRRLMHALQWAEALPYLEAAEASLGHPELADACMMLRAQALTRLGRLDEAQTAFEAFAMHPLGASREEAREGLDRIRWLRQRAAASPDAP